MFPRVSRKVGDEAQEIDRRMVNFVGVGSIS